MTTPYDPQGRQSGQSPPVPPPPPSYPGSMPPVGDFTPAPSGPVGSRPKEVDVSFWLWMTSVVIGLISVMVFVGQYDTFRDMVLEEARRQTQDQGGTIDEGQLDTLVTAGFVAALVISLLITLMYLLFAFLMRKGRNWARILLAVIGGISVLFGLSSLVSTSGGQLALTLISLIVVIGAIVTMFLPGANPWFRPAQRG